MYIASTIHIPRPKARRRSLVPPPFQFGPWNQFGNEFNATGYLKAIARFQAMDIPRSVFSFRVGHAGTCDFIVFMYYLYLCIIYMYVPRNARFPPCLPRPPLTHKHSQHSSVAIDPVHFFPMGSQHGNEAAILARNAAVRIHRSILISTVGASPGDVRLAPTSHYRDTHTLTSMHPPLTRPSHIIPYRN